MMNSEELISVIIPVYNAEKYIEEALLSITNQSYKNLEILVLNDGSSDKSKEIILSIKDDRIKYFENSENKGLIYTRNKLISLVKTNYVVFMDADDISFVDRIKKQYEYLKEKPDISILGCYYTIIPDNIVIENYLRSNEILEALLFSCPVGNPTVMINLTKVNNVLNYDENIDVAEDYNLWTKMIKSGFKIENYPEVLLQYRRHDNQTSTLKRKTLEDKANIIKKDYIKWFFEEKINDDLFFNGKKVKNSLISFNEIIKKNKVSKKILLDRIKNVINQESTFSLNEKYRLLKISHLYYYENKSFIRKIWWDFKILKNPKVITHPTYNN